MSSWSEISRLLSIVSYDPTPCACMEWRAGGGMIPPVALVFGTRPEIIKLSPIIRLLKKKRRPYFLIHTGQHYSYEMDRLFFVELALPAPRYHLGARSADADRQAEHTGRMMVGIEKILIARRPGTVLVQGDTNSVLAGSLAASKLHGIRLGHVEAGLRSYDRRMPEEINRMISDHVSDFLFAPTDLSKKILLGEGVSKEKIFVTGNTIVDAVRQNLRIAGMKKGKPAVSGGRGEFMLMTLHRQENVDDRRRLDFIMKGLELVIRKFRRPILFPIHPRTAKQLKIFRLRLPDGVRAVKPTGFLEFLALQNRARLVLTDSGGVQEETCILRVPCVTLRTTTERPETVKAGANLVAGFEPKKILQCAEQMLARKRNWSNPFGDGHASERILKVIESAF